MVLQYSHQYHALTRWSDNVRILETMAEQGLIETSQAQQLIEAYTCLRNEIHHRNLLNLEADVDQSRFAEHRACITELWSSCLGL